MRKFGVLCLPLVAAVAMLSFLGAPPANANNSGCYAHRPRYVEGVFEVRYDAGCSGHDEPEIDPLSSAPGSARELTWTVVLPSDGAFPVSNLGPTFWFGGTVTDPKSLFGQSFVELQFYPDSIVTSCGADGGFNVRFAPELNSSNSGPLMPAYDTQTIGDALGWGNVNDAPNAFVWEIGHESVF